MELWELAAIICGPGGAAFIGTKVAFNGLKEDVKEVKEDVKDIYKSVNLNRERLAKLEVCVGCDDAPI